jgi:hypothetical protein
MSRTIRGRLYVGDVQHRGEWFKGNHEAVFSQAEWDELQRALDTRRKGGAGGKGGRPTKQPFLFLGGTLRCECGSAMSPHTASGYGYYRCVGRAHGRTNCKAPSIRRETVEGAVVRYFDRAGLSDLEATRQAFEDQREHDLAAVRSLHDAAQRRIGETAEALDRIESDYVAGRITADQWTRLEPKLQAEHAEAVSEADQFTRREAELHAEHAEQDLQQATLQRLADLRSVLTAPVRDAETVDAVRLQLATIYDRFVLTRHCPDVAMGEQPTPAGDLYLRPVLREDAFDHVTTTTEQPIRSLRRPLDKFGV